MMTWSNYIILAVLLTNIYANRCSSRNATARLPFHPLCDSNITTSNIHPVADSVTDITGVFSGLDLPDGACVFNPATVHVAGNIYCIFARVYNSAEDLRRCHPGRLDRPPFLDGWRGHSANLLAVVRLRRRRGNRGLQALLLGHSYLEHSNHEDGRIFKDAHGRIFVYLALPLGVAPKRAVINTVSRVLIRCSRGTRRCTVSLGYPRLLGYFGGASIMDKNWVPWNGTALMSYSHYGSFGPHSVFDWGSYDEPVFHTGFHAVAEDALFPAFVKRYGHLLHLSGGTPAVLEPGGRSFLAVGHLKAHPGCFHAEVVPQWAAAAAAATAGGGGGKGGWSRCTHLATSSNEAQKHEVLKIAFIFGDPDDLGMHYPWDYAFFFYRFSASPPYNVTHISHGFIPYTGGRPRDHSGIVFPIGLEHFGAESYLISYGDSDQASRLLLVSVSQADAMLWPLERMRERLDDYTVCSLPCAGRVDCTAAPAEQP